MISWNTSYKGQKLTKHSAFWLFQEEAGEPSCGWSH